MGVWRSRRKREKCRVSWTNSLPGRLHGKAEPWCGAPKIASILDRKAEFLTLYEVAENLDDKLKLSAEMRLLEQAAARLIKDIKTDIPPAPSLRTIKARRAVRARWDRDDNASS
jgi:hypothetical protein